MDARTFLGLEPGDRDRRWTLPVVPGLSTGGNFLFGGCALGAAIEAMEQETGRPIVWATAQYLGYAHPPDRLDLDVTLAVHGRNTSQARVLCSVDGREILTVNGALGARPLEAGGQWAERPHAPRPEDCPPRRLRMEVDESILSRLDVRLADARDWGELDGTAGTGRCTLWARVPDVLEMSGGTLAILGDYVPFGIGQALGALAGGNSLDNTLRVVQLVPTEWVLLDIRVHAIAHGFGHGLVHLWADDGTLLATASQSVIVRFWKH